MLVVLRRRSVRIAIPHSCTSITEKRCVLCSCPGYQECARKTSTVGIGTRVFRLLLPGFSPLFLLSLCLLLFLSLSQGNSEENRGIIRHHDIVYTEDILSPLFLDAVFSLCGGNPWSWSSPLPPFLTSIKVKQKRGVGGRRAGGKRGHSAAAVAMVTHSSHQ